MFAKIVFFYSYVFWQTFGRLLLGKIGKGSFIQFPIGLMRNTRKVSIGKNTRILFSCRIDILLNWNKQTFNPRLAIGSNVNIGQNCFISCVDSITVGDGTLISDNVAIVDNSHSHDRGISSSSTGLDHSPITIGQNVTIYRNSTILAGTTLANNVVVAANSVVKDSFPANVMIGGVPAKILKCLE